jgi:hypothetical protein
MYTSTAQEEGDLLYIPMLWWHATLGLGENVGISGQLNRNVNGILQKALAADQRGDFDAALDDYRFITETHADEIEASLFGGVLTNLAVLLLKTGRFSEAQGVADTLMADRGLLALLSTGERERHNLAGQEINQRVTNRVDTENNPVQQID